MNDLNTPWPLINCIALFIIVAEIARNIYLWHIKKQQENDNVDTYKKNIAAKKENSYPFEYSGPLFIEAKNKFVANKKFENFKKNHKILSEKLHKKHNN
ncbi:hypothetical protein [Maribacter sp.]|uniref:hypothetical protein n=1 Tax=Maribacter sp. TaxID=1897614 RepID=UPI0025C17E70|nr:hypothetical protein [Maribacter sp.]